MPSFTVSTCVTGEELYSKNYRYARTIAYRMKRSYRLSQEGAEDITSHSLTVLLSQKSKIDFSQHESALGCSATV